MRDGNNSYFYAYIKAKQTRRNMRGVQSADATVLQSHDEIEKDILDFYGKLMGKEENNLQHIDIKAMRRGPELDME